MAKKMIDKAAELATRTLDETPARVQHSATVAVRAQSLAVTVAPSAAEFLIAAAWLHDIGYGSRLHDSGFHPLDGALYLREEGWPEDVCALVAHHSGSRFVARVLGLDDQLRQFEFIEDPQSDALTVADNTAGPQGTVMTVEQRLREKLTRHGPNSVNARANPERDDYIRAADRRVAHRLATLHVADEFGHRR
jgi:putative nucleotidyltransferase with HDIG domain